jgi:PBSX family phage terminase large subunit
MSQLPKIRATRVFKKNYLAATATDEHGARKYRYIINSGSSRSSKTYSIIQLFYIYALQHPNKKLSVFRDTKQICKQTVFEDMKKVYANMPGARQQLTLNLTESIFKFHNGSSIHIEGTDDSVKIHGYHCDVLWINEGYEVSKETFDQLDMRCSDFVILDLNPRQSHWSEDVAKSANATTIHSTFNDNPFVPNEQKKKILSYQPVKFAEVVQKKLFSINDRVETKPKDFNYDILAARDYQIERNPQHFTHQQIAELIRCRENEAQRSANAWNWEVYGLGLKSEKPNRIFHWEEISIEDYLRINATIYNGVDWGKVDPWGVLESKYYDGALYFHEKNYASENEIRDKLTPTELAQINAEDEGIVKWLFRKIGISTDSDVVCDTNRPLKIAALRRAGWERAVPAYKANISERIGLLNDIPCYYTSTSENLKYEQENYSYKVDRYGVVLEEAEDLNNHLIDPAGYIAEHLLRIGVIKRI